MKALLVVVFLVGLAFAINEIDVDGDGFFSDAERGEYQDCCDTVDDGCYDPYMVNPGAWEIPNNGQADRCIQGLDAIPTNVPCDWRFTNTTPSLQPIENQNPPAAGYINAMINPNPTQSQAEPGIVAMDICEFKDDDDDPSWGFCRQENLVFALADETRNGFDIGVVGPSPYQASVLSTFGHIEPVNGDYFLAISTGQAFDNAYAPLDRNTDWVSTVVEALPEWRRSTTFTGPCETAATRANALQVFDSILARFCMQQPTNMNAFSLKVMYLDLEMTPSGIRTVNDNFCSASGSESWLIITKNDTVGTPLDKNIAFDKHGNNIWSFNRNLDFFEQCAANPPTSWPDNVCPIDPYYLDNTGYIPAGVGTQWIPVGTAATPGRPFQLKMATWDTFDTQRDNVVLFDDFIPVAEARTQGTPYGYQWTSDIGLERLKPTRSGFYPASTTSITFDYLIKNYGPEQTSDVYVSFTPPKGTFYQSVSGGVGTPIVRTALAPYQDNSFYKYLAAQSLGVGQTVTGSITFGVHPDSPPDLQFRITATCASIEKDFGNNYQTRDIFIDKL